MSNILQGSLIWRVLLAAAGWIGRTFQSSTVVRTLASWWHHSGTRRFFLRHLSAEDRGTQTSKYTGFFTRCNQRLSKISWPLDWFRNSLIGRIYGAVFRCGSSSRLLGWLFRGGLTAFFLAALGLYGIIDFALRDVLTIPVISSVWDEALMLVSILWILRLRMDRKNPMEARTNPMDVPLLCFLVFGFYLMNTHYSYYSISVSGYRATVQYMLWFFVVTRMLRNDRDFMTLYYVMIAAATVIALHGIYQYIAAVPIPESWTDQAEQSVRTRVYSIFGSPNIMGDYMVMFAPMCAGLAYYLKKPWQKVLAWVCTFLMCFGCLFTMSRGAWVAMAIAVVLFCLLVDRRLFALLVVAAVGACFLPFVASRIGYLFTEQFAESTARGGRGSRWQLGMAYLRESNHPWIGLGLGMFGGAIAMQHQIIDGMQYFYLDNYYLKITAEMGYLGLAAFILLLVFLVVICCRCIFRGKKLALPEGKTSMRPLAAGMFSGLCGVLAHCYFENIFEEPYMMAYFWIMAAMVVYVGFLRPRTADQGSV